MSDNSSTTKSVLATVGVSAGVLISFLMNHYVQAQKNKKALEEGDSKSTDQADQLGEDEDLKKRRFIQSLIQLNKGKFKDFNRIKVKETPELLGNTLLDEIKFLDSALCEIEKVPNLILDLGLDSFEVIVNATADHTHKDTFINTNSFILSLAAFGPQSMIQNAKRWLRAGPRYHNYFQPSQSKALILTQDGLCPGLNVVIREVVMHLNYNYKVEEIYGARYGWKGIVNEDFVKLLPNDVKTIHHRGGTYLGTARTNFDRDAIIKSLVKNGFNQVYVICGNKSMSQVLELYYEIRRLKLNIAICNIPRSIDNDIPILDESFGYQSCVEEAQRIIESAWVESRSHRNGVAIIRLMGLKTGFISMGACLASRCVNICLIPEFSYNLYGKNGVLEYVRQRLLTKGDCILVVSEGATKSFNDVQQNIEDVGKFLQEELVKYCKQEKTETTVKYFDPLYMLRAVKANAYDTKLCSTLAQNAVHCIMAGFTGFCMGHVHIKTCMIPLEEILSGNYKNKITPGNKNWYRLLASTGQPSFAQEDKIIKVAS